MASPSETVRRLHADRDSGALSTLCVEHEVDLLVHFGSSRHDPEHAGDVDVAYSFRQGVDGDHLAVVNALGERYRDALDVMLLDRAGSVTAYAALGGGEVLFELTEQKFALRQMAAFGMFVDTQRFRDLQLKQMMGE